MEVRDIALVAYELMRAHEDRSSMAYEDQLSRAQRLIAESQEKYKKLKAVILEQKQLYNELVGRVTKMMERQHPAQTASSDFAGNKKRPRTSDSVALGPRTGGPLPIERTERTQSRAIPSHPEDSAAFTRLRSVASPAVRKEATLAVAGFAAEWDAEQTVDLTGDLAPPVPSSKPSLPPHLAPTAATTTEAAARGARTAHRSSSMSALSSARRPSAARGPVASSVASPSSSGELRPTASRDQPSAVGPKFVEVVRNKAQRAALPGFSCSECEHFYRTMMEQGIITDENRQEFMQSCSRHKSRWTPPSTPEGFWDLSLHTPLEWRAPDRL